MSKKKIVKNLRIKAKLEIAAEHGIQVSHPDWLDAWAVDMPRRSHCGKVRRIGVYPTKAAAADVAYALAAGEDYWR